MIPRKSYKQKRGIPPIDAFHPTSDLDRRIVAALEQAGYGVQFEYLKRPGTHRRWLAGYPRIITKGAEDGR